MAVKDIPKFIEKDREQVEHCLLKWFQNNIAIQSDETRESSKTYICFQYNPFTVKMLMEQQFGITPEIIQINENTYYMLQPHPDKDHPDLYVPEIQWWIKKSNIPYVAISDQYGKFRISSAYPGFADEEQPGFFYRPDIQFAPRSSWEANIARVFNYLSVPFEYEKSIFPREESYYIPDFFLSDNRIVEVKGFWNPDSRKKAQEFLKNHTEYRYYIIDGDMYPTIKKRYKNDILEWEEHPSENHFPPQILQVVGINFGKRAATVRTLEPGQPITLVRDANNQYDSNAILAYTEDGREIGFISSDWACIYAPKLDMGMTFTAEIKTALPERKKVEISLRRKNVDTEILYDFLRK